MLQISIAGHLLYRSVGRCQTLPWISAWEKALPCDKTGGRGFIFAAVNVLEEEESENNVLKKSHAFDIDGRVKITSSFFSGSRTKQLWLLTLAYPGWLWKRRRSRSWKSHQPRSELCARVTEKSATLWSGTPTGWHQRCWMVRGLTCSVCHYWMFLDGCLELQTSRYSSTPLLYIVACWLVSTPTSFSNS